MPVVVEVLLLSAGRTGPVFRRTVRPLTDGSVPDDCAAELAGLTHRHALLHSTSWRFQSPRLIILTYAALPDPQVSRPGRKVQPHIAQAPDALDPHIDASVEEVAAHACRHLEFLYRTDATVAAALRRHRRLVRQLCEFMPDLAGEV